MSPSPQNFRATDIVVIIALWALQFYDNWISSLFIHTSDVIHGESKETAFHRNALLYILVGKCILACVLAVVVDAYNHKYAVAFGGMCLYTITPVLALTMCITEKQELLVPTLCASSLLFVTSPAAFGVIFNQNERPVRIQVRRLVAIMEFVQGMLLVMIREFIPEEASRSERNSMVASWVIVIPLIVFIITILEQVRKYVRKEELKERGVVAISKGIRNDVSGTSPRTGLGKLNVLVFVLLLLPAFSLTSLSTAVANLKPSDDTQFQHPSLKRIIDAGQLTIIPITEVAISYAPLREIVAELLVLGMAHVLNIGVLTVLCIQILGGEAHRPVVSVEIPDNHLMFNQDSISSIESNRSEFSTSATLQQSTRITRVKRSLPDGQFLFIIINHSAVDLYIEDTLGILIEGAAAEVEMDSGTYPYILPSSPSKISAKEVTVSLIIFEIAEFSQPKKRINFTVTLRDKMFRYIGIWGDSKLGVSLGGDDVDMPEFLDPSLSMIIMQNTIVGNSYFGQTMMPNEHEIEILTTTGNQLAIVQLPRHSESLVLTIPTSDPGQDHIMKIRYKGDDPKVKESLRDLTTRIECNSSNVYVLSVGIKSLAPSKYLPWAGIIYQAKPPPTTPAPFVPDNPDVVVATTFAVFGATVGMTTVGYIHFFWMGAPIRLRTTLYAWFIVSNELLSWFTSQIIGDEVGINEAIILLSVAIATAVWHFAFGWYYEHKVVPKEFSPRK